MARTHYKALLQKALIGFLGEEDPVLAMLQWVAQEMMQIEAEAKVGTEKRNHSKEWRTHFSGVKIRQMDKY